MERALFIGRFQPFHRGHKHAVEQAQQEYDLVVGIGSAEQKDTMHNPLSYDERKQVLQNCLENIQIEPIPDQDDDPTWMDMIEERFSVDTCISGNDHVRRLFNERDYRVVAPSYKEPDRLSGTAIRERAARGNEWRSMVPTCSEDVLESLGFPQRIKKIYENDG